MWKVTMTRTGWSVWAGEQLALEPLVIDGNPHTGAFHLTEEDCTWPTFTIRRTYASDSAEIAGRPLLKAVCDQGTQTLKISAHGDNTTEMLAAMEELQVCTSQFTYELALEVGGVLVGTYEAHSEMPLWGALDSGMVRAALNEATITIPLNPPGSA